MASRSASSTHKPIEIRDGHIFTEAVEINAAWHCNIRCQWCSHASPGLQKRYADVSAVVADLTALSKFLKVDHIRILGGEPLLHPQLNRLIENIRSTGIGNKVRVLTNGLILHRMSPEFWRNVDEVHISVYPNTARLVQRHLQVLHAAAEAYGVTLVLKYFNYFRTSYRADDGDQGLTKRIYHTCQIANVWRCITLEEGYLYRCPQAAYLQHISSETKKDNGLDFLKVQDITSTFEFEQWFRQESALTSCRICTGSVGMLQPHQQLHLLPDETTMDQRGKIDLDFLARLEFDMNAGNSCVVQEVVLHEI